MTAHAAIRLGTRASLLARTQAGWVADRLRAAGHAVTLELISTSGDERPDLAVPRLGTDGVFVRELEAALLDGRIDAAVHSLKDLPTSETPGLTLGCTPLRAIPFDVLVGRSAARIADLPQGAVVGTSSVRRRLQLKALRGDLEVRPARGNVDSRLRRLDAGEYDALVLAGAGLERLGLESRITEVLQPDAFWPAIAQGALVIQTRAGDGATQSAVAVLHDAATHAAVVAERAFLATLAGGCLAPIGAWAHHDEAGLLQLGGCVLEERDGVVRRIVALRTAATGETPASVGQAVARQLQAAGAEAMLEAARSAPGR